MSKCKPSPMNSRTANADGWCPEPVEVLAFQESDIAGPTDFTPVPWPLSRILGGTSKIGYVKEITVLCQSKREIRTITKQYYFDSKPGSQPGSTSTKIAYHGAGCRTEGCEQ